MSSSPDQGPMDGVTPHLTIGGGRAMEAIDFYKRAFGATEAMPPMPAGGEGNPMGMAADDKRVMHAHLKLNGGSLMLNDDFPEFGKGPQATPTGATLHLQVDDADKWFERATAAGATTAMPLDNAFWGDRYGQVTDPFGFTWSIGGPIRN